MGKGATAEIYRDNTPFASGTHQGATGATVLSVPGADFLSCGVVVGALLRNTTDESEGTITVVTESSLTAALAGGTNNFWTLGDSYEVYNSGTYNGVISKVWTDRSHGWKVKEDNLDRGWRPEDVDEDRDDPKTFGPGQPQRGHR